MMWGMLKSGWGRGPRNNSGSGTISVSGRCRSRCIAGRGHGIRPPRGVIRRLLLPSGCVMIWCGGPWTFTCRQFLASWNKQLNRIMMLLNIFVTEILDLKSWIWMLVICVTNFNLWKTKTRFRKSSIQGCQGQKKQKNLFTCRS